VEPERVNTQAAPVPLLSRLPPISAVSPSADTTWRTRDGEPLLEAERAVRIPLVQAGVLVEDPVCM
jgi:hypothetical protein